MEVKRGRKPVEKKEEPKVEAVIPQPAKPTIVVRAKPITSHPAIVQRQSNQVMLLNIKTGKRTPMGATAAAKMERKYPKEFKVV